MVNIGCEFLSSLSYFCSVSPSKNILKSLFLSHVQLIIKMYWFCYQNSMAIYSYLFPIGCDGPSLPCLTGLFLYPDQNSMFKSYINHLVTITQGFFFPLGSLTILMKIRKLFFQSHQQRHKIFESWDLSWWIICWCTPSIILLPSSHSGNEVLFSPEC